MTDGHIKRGDLRTHSLRKRFSREGTRPGAGRRQRRREETREKIYQAALRLLAERGYNATTIEAITEAADVGKGTFFNYFESKDHVLLRFRDKRIDIIQSLLNEKKTSHASLASVLHTLAIALTREFGMNAALFQSFIIAAFTHGKVQSGMSEGLAKGRKLISDLIAQRQQQGEIRNDLSSRDIAYAFQRMVLGTLVLWSMNPTTLLEDELGTMVEILLSGIQTGARNPKVSDDSGPPAIPPRRRYPHSQRRRRREKTGGARGNL